MPGDYRSDVKQSVNAGMDMVMVPKRYREFTATLRSLVDAGEVPMARIDDAVRRILRVKAALGLLTPAPPVAADRTLEAAFGSARHRALARRAVQQSLVVLKNERKTLPLRPGVRRVHVAGSAADDLGVQCGGWTITWQGRSGSPTTGTTVLAALREELGRRGAAVTYAKDGAGSKGADLAVVVIGEPPYAEYEGDSADLALRPDDVRLVETVKATGVHVVTVLLSGRPLTIGPVLARSDALVAAWLPGTEGGGVADVLLGTVKPTGMLPFTWPRTVAQVPINVGDATYDPLFPYGHGLTY